MPTLFRFLMILGVIGGVIAGSLYVLAEYFQPEPKEISKALRNVKGRIEETTASTPSADAGDTSPPIAVPTGRPGGPEDELPPLPDANPSNPGAAPPAPRPNSNFPAPPSIAPQASEAAESPLPYDLWRGVDAAALKQLLAATPLPFPSPVLATLIARALVAGDQTGGEEVLLRVDALERAGRVTEAVDLLRRAVESNDPGALGRYALALLASRREDDACEVRLTGAPGPEALLVPAYCAAAKGDLPGARLALDLARDGGADVGLASAVVGRLNKAGTHASNLPKKIGVMDYLFLTLGGERPTAGLAAAAEPPLLFLLTHDQSAPAEPRVAATERAASLNIIAGEDLARAYREAAQALPNTAKSSPALRARLFAAFESAPSVKIRAEFDRSAARLRSRSGHRSADRRSPG